MPWPCPSTWLWHCRASQQGHHRDVQPCPRGSSPALPMPLHRRLQPAPAPLSMHKEVNLATAVQAETGPGAEPGSAGRSRPAGCSPSPGSSTSACLRSNVSVQRPPAQPPQPLGARLHPSCRLPASTAGTHRRGPWAPLGRGATEAQTSWGKSSWRKCSLPRLCAWGHQGTARGPGRGPSQGESGTTVGCCIRPISAIFQCCKSLLQLDVPLSPRV